ncbi:hypothetical protein JQS43_19145 [Natronosporangium hydrolyticum]|uniref:Uncharacterized protein n=1 Tax=Natronosporangium hydrolyticum TaxID=2811111 RepID=A0A895YE04_9ACTN|nr:hypothetical protein [Natronosporangium hydrolyticum]QSB13673.1 hypothetical protein JQS43_19145 [Natronosporangium hydrolyticum]
MDRYAEMVVPAATRVGQRVANLGVDTTSAGSVVHNSDVDAATTLHRQSGTAAEQGSFLSRPVNSWTTAT